MGCVGSKPDDSPAITLCRQRCHFLDEAIHQRYVLAESHLAYFHSLKSLSHSLHRFFDLHSASAATSSYPVKRDSSPPPATSVTAAPVITHRRSHSNSGSSHLRFCTDSDDDSGDEDESLNLHSDNGDSSLLHHQVYGNLMRKQPALSVSYQQRSITSEPIHYGEASASSSYINSYNNQSPNYSYNNNYSNYVEFFGSSSSQQPPYGGISSRPPVLPPPPPLSSDWEFLNPFETFERYYPPCQDSREAREEEGIPDLEDDTGGGAAMEAVVVDEEIKENVVAKEENPVEYDVMVDKELVEDQKKPLMFQNDSEIVNEIQTQFDIASKSGNELAMILEAGKLPHNRKHVAYQVPSKMLNVFAPSLADPANMDIDIDFLAKSKNLSSTLHKLYLWEKKLFDEVKIEETMRLLHEKTRQRLVRLDEKGADPHKINTTKTFVRNLSTKIRIAIQIIDKISEKINNLRDEELLPQLNDFIEGLTKMWKSMLECHVIQCQAINASKHINATSSNKHPTDTILDATSQLEHELLNWAIRFSCWFQSQKRFVKSLNNWLLKCLIYEPEQTVDALSRLGAPIIFVICNQWAQEMEKISDKEVVDSIQGFAITVLPLWERDKVVDINTERNFAKEDKKIRDELQILDKMIIVASGNDERDLSLKHHVYQRETSKNGNLQRSLQRVFESMERFTTTLLKAYEELLKRIEEDKLAKSVDFR